MELYKVFVTPNLYYYVNYNPSNYPTRPAETGSIDTLRIQGIQSTSWKHRIWRTENMAHIWFASRCQCPVLGYRQWWWDCWRLWILSYRGLAWWLCRTCQVLFFAKDTRTRLWQQDTPTGYWGSTECWIWETLHWVIPRIFSCHRHLSSSWILPYPRTPRQFNSYCHKHLHAARHLINLSSTKKKETN